MKSSSYLGRKASPVKSGLGVREQRKELKLPTEEHPLNEHPSSQPQARRRKEGSMDLTPENKKHIDSMSYEALLRSWRNSPIGNRWFQGETGEYWAERMKELRSQPGGQEKHIEASKFIGWE